MPSSSTTSSSRPLNPALNLILFLVKIILDMMYSLKSITFTTRPVPISPTASSQKAYDPANDISNDEDDENTEESTHDITEKPDDTLHTAPDLDLPPQYDELPSPTIPTLPSLHHNTPTDESHDSDSSTDVELDADPNVTSPSKSDATTLPRSPSSIIPEKDIHLKRLEWSNAGLPGLFLRSSKKTLDSQGTITRTIPAVSLPVPAPTAIPLPLSPISVPTPTVHEVPVTFTVQHSNASASNLYLTGSLPCLKSWSPHDAIPMTRRGETWNVTIPLPPCTPFEYKYIHKPHSGSIVWDQGPNRRSLSPRITDVDSTDPSTETSERSETKCVDVTFNIYAETVWGEQILLTGSSPHLSSWSTTSAIALSTSKETYPIWSVTLSLPPTSPPTSTNRQPLEFKFIRKHTHRPGVWWEAGANRKVSVEMARDSCVEVNTVPNGAIVDGVWRW